MLRPYPRGCLYLNSSDVIVQMLVRRVVFELFGQFSFPVHTSLICPTLVVAKEILRELKMSAMGVRI